jgi:hypothetical protein
MNESEMSIESLNEDDYQPEVILSFDFQDGELNVTAVTREEPPNPESLAVILASYITNNVQFLVQQAQEAKAASERPKESAGANLSVIATRPVRSLTSVDGGLAKDAPAIVGPNGERLS